MRISDWSSDVCSSDLTRADCRGERVPDIGVWQDLHLEQFVPNREMQIDQLVDDEACRLGRLARARDFALEQVPDFEQRAFAGAIGGLDIVGLARPYKQDPHTDVDRPRLDRKSTRLNSSH